MPAFELTFPLVSRRRLVGLAFGAMHSARRGMGSDVAGSRPYVPGDDVDAIDWGATARLSSARGTEEFVVREMYAEEAPRVVVVCDRRPAMALYGDDLPWLSKADAMREAAEIVAESAIKARGFIGYLDFASGEPFFRPPASQRELWHIKERHLAWPDYSAPEDNVAQALRYLGGHRRALPAGSFLFVISDFLVPPPQDVWRDAVGHRWDVVPVVIQDPVWERSFPPIANVVVPLAEPGSPRPRLVRLSKGDVERRRRANEERHERLLADFRAAGLEPILLESSDPQEIFGSFMGWSDERRLWRGRAA